MAEHEANAPGFVLEVPPSLRAELCADVRRGLLADSEFLEKLTARANDSPWLHGVEALSRYTGIPVSTLKKLTARREVPCHPQGDGLNAPLAFSKPEIDKWMRTRGSAKMGAREKAGGA
jgi:hypothetical protein